MSPEALLAAPLLTVYINLTSHDCETHGDLQKSPNLSFVPVFETVLRPTVPAALFTIEDLNKSHFVREVDV